MITNEDLKKAFDKFMESEDYTPPIEVYQTIENVNRQFAKDVAKQREEQILWQVNQYVDVDKDELIKALNYDREQYHKGFEDGVKSVLSELEIYKRALELSCVDLDKMCDTTRHCDEVNCPLYDDCINDDNWEERFLKKAREEE